MWSKYIIIGLRHEYPYSLLLIRHLAQLPQLSFFIMFPAKRHIALIRSQEDLGAFAYDFAIGVPCVALGAAAAPADGRDFLDNVCDFHKAPGAWEKVVQEIGAQAVADHRNIVEIHQI